VKEAEEVKEEISPLACAQVVGRPAVALRFLHYNFCRIHQTLRVTPAMAAGVTDHVWEIADIVALLNRERKAA
jgi:hypothetical protein